MVQNMYNPEYYFQQYEVKNTLSEAQEIRCGMYADFARCLVLIQIVSYSSSVHNNRFLSKLYGHFGLISGLITNMDGNFRCEILEEQFISCIILPTMSYFLSAYVVIFLFFLYSYFD